MLINYPKFEIRNRRTIQQFKNLIVNRKTSDLFHLPWNHLFQKGEIEER